MPVIIARLDSAQWPQVREIYLQGIATGLTTFETRAPSWEQWDQGHLAFGRLVALAPAEVCGWAALGAISARPAYAGVAEVSVYVGAQARGQGVGRLLLERLIIEAEQNSIWTLQASIFPENLASVRLHTRCGFREVGTRRRIGQLSGVWRDTVLFERRSRVVGAD